MHPFRGDVEGQEYIYFPSPYPDTRVKAIYGKVSDPFSCEAYTCLVAGTRYNKTAPKLALDDPRQHLPAPVYG